MRRFGLAAVLIVFEVMAGSAVASAAQVVVATFGGSFADFTKSCEIAPFEQKTGAKVLLQLGNSVQIAASIRAAGGHPAYDVAYMDNSLATELNNEKLLAPLDVAKLKSYPEIHRNAFGPGNAYVAFEVSATAIVYNPKKVTTTPTSWNDLFAAKYKGRMALGDITGTSGLQFLLAVNKMRGGTYDNMNPGFAALKKLEPNAVTLYTQADQLVALFERGDIVIAPWYPDRAGSAIDKGLSLAVAYPKEGAVGIKPVLVIPKGAPDPALALAYVDTVLSRTSQSCFAEHTYAAPVNKTVQLSPKVKHIVATGADYDRLWFPDPEEIAKHLPQWTERWQREVAR